MKELEKFLLLASSSGELSAIVYQETSEETAIQSLAKNQQAITINTCEEFINNLNAKFLYLPISGKLDQNLYSALTQYQSRDGIIQIIDSSSRKLVDYKYPRQDLSILISICEPDLIENEKNLILSEKFAFCFRL